MKVTAMKNRYVHYIMLLAAALVFAACNNEWEDELFQQSVSFAKNGVPSIYVKYKTDGKVTYQLPVIVSGSTDNDKNLRVQIGLDPDTLNTLNFERFRFRDDLYFVPLEEKFYTVPEMFVDIPAGSKTGLLNINLTLTGINLVREHVLPLTILEGDGYAPNYRKHYRKALLNVIPFNDYSGSYASTTAMIYNRNVADDKQTAFSVSTRKAWVVDESSIFFYAGATDEELKERETYKVVATFGEPDEKKEGILTLSNPDPENRMKFAQVSGTYKVEINMDTKLPYLEHKYVTMYFEYQYSDIANESYPMNYKVTGSMIMERKRNINIPEEDQSYFW